MFKVTIREASKEMTARERIKFKDISNTESLDKLVTPGNGIEIKPVAFAILDVENDRADEGSYVKYIIEDNNGILYSTGSDSFFNTFYLIHSEMQESGEDYTLLIMKKESKNYSGKHFLTCTIK